MTGLMALTNKTKHRYSHHSFEALTKRQLETCSYAPGSCCDNFSGCEICSSYCRPANVGGTCVFTHIGCNNWVRCNNPPYVLEKKQS
jgi:hypothetical protein